MFPNFLVVWMLCSNFMCSLKKLPKAGLLRLILTVLLAITTVFSNAAQSLAASSNATANLPLPGKLTEFSQRSSHAVLKGIKIDPQNPFRLEFILDRENSATVSENEIGILIEYFLTALTIPEDDLWVNLSPFEQNRIIPEKLGLTELGKDLLRQDYLLKQIAASSTYPEKGAGQKYWQDINNDKIKGEKGNFSKIWIIPDRATIHEADNSVLITQATLKVMIEADYIAMAEKTQPDSSSSLAAFRRHILPLIEKEVNEGANFASIRQIYHSVILAAWFKQKLKDSIFRYYLDKRKITGIDPYDETVKEKIFDLYAQAYRKGAYRYIKREFNRSRHAFSRREYYSGGCFLGGSRRWLGWRTGPLSRLPFSRLASAVTIVVGLNVLGPNAACTRHETPAAADFSQLESTLDFLNFFGVTRQNPQKLKILLDNLDKLVTIINQDGRNYDPAIRSVASTTLFSMLTAPQDFPFAYDRTRVLESLKKSVKGLKELASEKGALDNTAIVMLARQGYAFALDGVTEIYSSLPQDSSQRREIAGLLIDIAYKNAAMPLKDSISTQGQDGLGSVGKVVLPALLGEPLAGKLLALRQAVKIDPIVTFIKQHPSCAYLAVNQLGNAAGMSRQLRQRGDLPWEIRFYALGVSLASMTDKDAVKTIIEEGWTGRTANLLEGKAVKASLTGDILLGNAPLARKERMKAYAFAVAIDAAKRNGEDISAIAHLARVVRESTLTTGVAFIDSRQLLVGKDCLKYRPSITFGILRHEMEHQILAMRHIPGHSDPGSNLMTRSLHEFISDGAAFEGIRNPVDIGGFRQYFKFSSHFEQWRKNNGRYAQDDDSHYLARAQWEYFFRAYDDIPFGRIMKAAEDMLFWEGWDATFRRSSDLDGTFLKFTRALEQRVWPWPNEPKKTAQLEKPGEPAGSVDDESYGGVKMAVADKLDSGPSGAIRFDISGQELERLRKAAGFGYNILSVTPGATLNFKEEDQY